MNHDPTDLSQQLKDILLQREGDGAHNSGAVGAAELNQTGATVQVASVLTLPPPTPVAFSPQQIQQSLGTTALSTTVTVQDSGRSEKVSRAESESFRLNTDNAKANAEAKTVQAKADDGQTGASSTPDIPPGVSGNSSPDLAVTDVSGSPGPFGGFDFGGPGFDLGGPGLGFGGPGFDLGGPGLGFGGPGLGLGGPGLGLGGPGLGFGGPGFGLGGPGFGLGGPGFGLGGFGFGGPGFGFGGPGFGFGHNLGRGIGQNELFDPNTDTSSTTSSSPTTITRNISGVYDGSDKVLPQNITGSAGGDTITTGLGDDIIHAGSGNDTITANAGDDTIFGGAGDDTFIAGPGNDTIHAGSGSDIIKFTSATSGVNVNLASGIASGTDIGFDTLYDIENVSGSSGNDTITGDAGVNQLSGGAGNDIIHAGSGDDLLDGGTGADQMTGGNGADIYVVDNAGDTVNEVWGDGSQDTVQSWLASYTLSNAVESLTLMGSGNIDGTGNHLNNTIQGNAGDNVIDGGTSGWNVINGGAGNDTITNYSGTIHGDGGNDTISGGTFGDGLWGGDGNDTISGGGGNDNLWGGDGNDLLDGGTGADYMAGGDGADIYVVDNLNDVVSEVWGDGAQDTVQSWLASYTLGGAVENLSLMGSGNIDGTGNQLNNTIHGNAGDNVIDGGTGGWNVINGGAGNDTITNYYGTIHGDDGNDTINGGLFGDGLWGGDGNDTIGGGGGNDNLWGGDGNDLLDGGAGADHMTGGDGADIYVVDNLNDVVSEVWGDGAQDTVKSWLASYTLGGAVEDLTLMGSGNIDGTGNQFSNTIRGNAGDNVIDGGSGGWDVLSGGAGNDVLTISSVGQAFGEDGNDMIYGGTSGDGLFGGLGNDILSGGGGNDNIWGGGGNDLLDGGAGADTFKYDSATDGSDHIISYTAGTDKFEFFTTGLDKTDGSGTVATGSTGIGAEFLYAVDGSSATAVSGTAGVLYEFYDGTGDTMGLELDFQTSTNAQIITAVYNLLAASDFDDAALSEGSAGSSVFAFYETTGQGSTADAVLIKATSDGIDDSYDGELTVISELDNVAIGELTSDDFV